MVMGVGRNFSRGKRQHFAYSFQIAMQMDLHKTLYLSYTRLKMTHVTATITKNALRWQRYPGPRYTTIMHTVGQGTPNVFGRGPHKLIKGSRAGHHSHT